MSDLPPVASRKVPPMLEGMSYDFLTSDGTLYKDAILVAQDEDGIWIGFKQAHVFLAAHELVDAS
jgi:hypothetical protein